MVNEIILWGGNEYINVRHKQCSCQNKRAKSDSIQTWQTVRIQPTIVPRSPNFVIETHKKPRSACTVKLQATANKMKMLSIAQHCFYGEFVAGDNKTYLGLHIKWPIFCRILTKFGVSRQIFTKLLSSKFHWNPHYIVLIYIYSTNIPPTMIINRIYEHQNLLSL